MKIYALISNGIVFEVIPPRTYDTDLPNKPDSEPSRIGMEIPITERFTPEMVAEMVDITDIDPAPQEGWTYSGTVFAAPVPYQPSPADIAAANQAQKSSLEIQASQAMTPLLVSLQLGNATADETTKAKAWQAYCRALQTVDVTVAAPAWPVVPT
ncbi:MULTISPECIES: tail fiber assembly protein [Pseudomonas]|uniref:tail fiber assembly protein n=1 Tax=Pseudomonas TaxID=286 RepID=UPI001FF63AD9|nr:MULTISPECIES: tail fiber assembly protein [Pseudomonas]